MAKPISNDLRERIIKDSDCGSTCRETADRFDVAPSTVVNLRALARETGSIEPRPRGGDKRSERIEALADVILALIEARPDITLAEIAEHLEHEHAERFGQTTIWRFFDRRDITHKKNRARQRAETP